MFSAFKNFPFFFAFPTSVSPEPSLCFSPKRQQISSGFSLMLPIFQHLHLCLTTSQLLIWTLIFKTQDQNLSTSNAEWGSGAAAAKPRRGRDRDQHKVSLQMNKKSSSGCHIQTRGYYPREHNLSFRSVSHGRLQVLQVGRLPYQDPCSFVLPVSFPLPVCSG